jgi:O-antigen/teichoic acid export membrane protein
VSGSSNAPQGDRERIPGAPEPAVPVDPAAATPGFRRFTRDSLIYSIGFLSGKATGLLLLPVMTRVLSPEDFGRLDVLSSLGSGLAGALLLGLDAAAVRLYFDQVGNRARGSLLGTWAVILAGLGTIAAIALLVFGPAISRVLFGPETSSAAGLALALVVPASLAQVFVVTSLRTTGQPAAHAAVAGSTFILYATLIVVLAGLGLVSVAAIMLSWGTALAITAGAGLLRLRPHLHWDISRRLASALVSFGLPMAPIVAVTVGSDFIHRAILLGAAGPAEVAQLTVALRFASVVGLGVASFQLAWQPRVYAMGISDLALRRIAIDSRRLVFGISAIGVALALVSPIAVPIVAGPNYEQALPALSWCIVAAILAGGYAALSTPSAIARRPADLTGAAIAGVAVAIAANLLLAPRFGSAGTGASMVIGQLCAVIVVGLAGRRRLPIPFAWARMGATVAAGSIVSLVAAAPGIDPVIRVVVVVVAVVVVASDPTVREALAVVGPARGSETPRDDGQG